MTPGSPRNFAGTSMVFSVYVPLMCGGSFRAVPSWKVARLDGSCFRLRKSNYLASGLATCALSKVGSWHAKLAGSRLGTVPASRRRSRAARIFGSYAGKEPGGVWRW
jgi:hypothetical protein